MKNSNTIAKTVFPKKTVRNFSQDFVWARYTRLLLEVHAFAKFQLQLKVERPMCIQL